MTENVAAQESEPAAALSPPPETVQVKFYGDSAEYFRIWIVNVLLSIVTLGIYSAWAKVRTRRYLYGNTDIGGHRFSYLADPVRILKGRIVAVILLALYFMSWQFWPQLGFYAFAAIVVLLPAILVMAAGFNMRNTAFRHMRFSFTRDIAGAYLMVALPVLLALGLTWLMYGFFSSSTMADVMALSGLGAGSQLLFTLFLFALMPFIPWLDCKRVRFTATRTSFGRARMGLKISAASFYGIWFMGGLFTMVIAVAVAIVTATIVGVVTAGGVLDPENVEAFVFGAGMFFAFLFYALLFYVAAYMRARKVNLVMNALTIADTRVQSSLDMWQLGNLYVTNTLAIIVTLGMAIPWARIRAARYVASCTQVIAVGLDDMEPAVDSDRSAMGEEFGEAFGFDFGL